jgi:hypothetical protein
VRARCLERAKRTGRMIPEEKLRLSLQVRRLLRRVPN